MTKAQKTLLAEIAAGGDINMMSQLVFLQDNKRETRRLACTVLALLKQRMLQHAKGGGLEISALGRETVIKHQSTLGKGHSPHAAPPTAGTPPEDFID